MRSHEVQISFKLLNDGHYHEDVFFRLLIACAISFVIFLAIHKKRYQWKYFLNDIKTGLFLISTLLFLTPVFKSLTVSYSEDTIILLVVSKPSSYLSM